MDPISGLITLGSGLLTGLAGMGDSPSEEAFKKLFDELYNNMDYLKQTPFSKEELFNTILPAVQNTYRGGASVAAGAIGSTIPETSGGTPKGQAFMDYYIQSLAPVIAQGEQLAGQSYENFTKLWAGMDTAAKDRFLQAIQVGGNLAGGLPSMTPLQKFTTNFLQGADLSATAKGNLDLGSALGKQAEATDDMLKGVYAGSRGSGQGGNQDINSLIAQFMQTGMPKAGGG